MPTYTFRLMDDGGGVADNVGLRLADAKVAYCHACDVAHELMDHREERTRCWRLDVYENGAKKLFEILFASIDETLDHLKPENRKLVEMTAMRRRSLQDTLYAARISYRESQALVARSQGKPYLAVDHGQKTIRDWN
jgi:DNA-binding transcriptional regulator PaaX